MANKYVYCCQNYYIFLCLSLSILQINLNLCSCVNFFLVADGEPTFKDTKFKFTLDDIMTFTTGMPREPPLGFIPEPSLAFLHDPTEVFPEANTCANILYLPTKHTKSLDNFGWAVCYGVLNAGGFGKI